MELRFFCIPYSGGDISIFRNWPNNLPPWINVCPIQLPGRGKRLREAAISDLSTLVQHIGDAVASCKDLDFAIFGHSFGALTAFEVCRYLRQVHGRMTKKLFVSSRPAPHLPPELPIYELEDDAFWRVVGERYGYQMPREVARVPELMAQALRALRADITASDTYRYSQAPPLECDITAICGLDDSISRGDIETWQVHTTATFTARFLPGDHFFIHASEHFLLRLLQKELGKARQAKNNCSF
jgi:medium-chain acyl-[acyl-carrier-protein] hydrolase